MFHLDVLQNRWLFLALLGGAALTLCLVAAYLAYWQPRRRPAPGEPREGWLPTSQAIPWLLILTYIAIAIFALVYSFIQHRTPPNW